VSVPRSCGVEPGVTGMARRPKLSDMRAIPWVDLIRPVPTEMLSHIYGELGRLAIDVDDLPKGHRSILREVETWLAQGLAGSIASVAVEIDRRRRAGQVSAPGAICVRVRMSRQGGLTVDWDWSGQSAARSSTEHAADRSGHLRLVGAERPILRSIRPPVTKSASNQLLGFRHLGGLGGFSQRCSKPELDALSVLLIFLARCCYEALLENLSRHAEIEAADRFAFNFARTQHRPFQQLRSWTIERAPHRADGLVDLGDRRNRGEVVREETV
jgi:hypothetical protein